MKNKKNSDGQAKIWLVRIYTGVTNYSKEQNQSSQVIIHNLIISLDYLDEPEKLDDII